MNKKVKYLQIFNYLREFSKLRSNPVRDIELQESQYPEKLWFSDVPQDDHFENVIMPDFNNENDYWLNIKKPKEVIKPTFAKLPIDLEAWIVPESLLDENVDPRLNQTIEIDGKRLSIDDFPRIYELLENYKNGRWIDDLIEYNSKLVIYNIAFEEYNRLNNVYKQLFKIFNKTEQLGEEYELVVGVGLLNFHEGNEHPSIFRHIFTQRVDIQFFADQRESRITLLPNLESSIQVETDSILDLVEQFDPSNIIEAEKCAQKIIEVKEISSLFDKELHEAIGSFSQRFCPEKDGDYIEFSQKPSHRDVQPKIYFSPAILLRKRNTRSLTALYEKILKNIDSESADFEIPTINDLIGIQEVNEEELNIDRPNDSSKHEPIYFPKEYNDEQVEIVTKSRLNNKVLVQGPPGTGKSHTISNLICHLLANGKKILVTAYTKRALEVLKEKLPEEFQGLTVNLLSGDSSSIQDLQSSVNSINDELSRSNLHIYQSEIDEFESRLKATREEISITQNELIGIKEISTRQQEINPKYTGTLTEISESLERDHETYNWYHDSYGEVENYDVLSSLENYLKLYNIYRSHNISEYKLSLPFYERLPTLNAVTEFEQLSEMVAQFDSSTLIPNEIVFNEPDLKILLIELSQAYKQFDNMSYSLKENIKESLKNGGYQNWSATLDSSKLIESRISSYNLKEIDQDIEITYPSSISLKQLKHDCQILLDYLLTGHSFTGLSFTIGKAFLPAKIKERLYFINGVKVNGSPCDTIDEFKIVQRDLMIQQDFHELSLLWIDQQVNHDSYSKKHQHFHNHISEANNLLRVFEQSESVRKEIASRFNFRIKLFDEAAINLLITSIDYNSLFDRYQGVKKVIADGQTHLKQGSHPINQKFLNAIANADHEEYVKCISDLDELIIRNEGFLEFKRLETKLSQFIPHVIVTIQSGDSVDLNNLQSAFLYLHAKNSLEKLLNRRTENDLFEALKSLMVTESSLIAKLASKKAWSTVVKGLQQNRTLRQHLEAWVMAIKKIGKTGKGKRSLKFRKVAQQEMEYCKDTIPCWIMPLYKVAETINPVQGMYDFVIIDEASQLGPDAIFLLYISKNIIIVGDDKQTSPEYIGVDSNMMTPHIQRHLHGIPYSDFYGTEFSFFDHAKLFCTGGGVTVLREHFRCMPEIIEFCNKHFYAPDGKGLYPLKQYSEKRLTPLRSVFCVNGYTEGKASNIINDPEANEIVKTIIELTQNPSYKNKTFGIITLQGNQQANLIENLLLKSLGESEFQSRKIVCGNSSSFQGDERDIILLSLVTALNHNRSALVRPEDERRFNVAVSRAKEQIWLFHSVNLEDLSNKNDLRYKVLDHFKNYKSKQTILSSPIERHLGTQPEPFDSWFEVDVYNDIINKGLSVIPQYEVAKGKYRIDLVMILADGTKIAIECDGDKWHGPEQYQNDLMRQRVLERCGWQFFRVRGYEYYCNRVKALERLWGMIPTQQSLDSLDEQIVDKRIEANDEVDLEAPTNEERQLPLIGKGDTNSSENKILCYFNLYKSGTYILTLTELADADYTIPIKINHQNGFLLQCYDSGHINKVFVRTLLSKKLGKQYMNGRNTSSELLYLRVIDKEKIIGLFITDNGKKRFKAHLTENISAREQLHLQGFKVIYGEFQSVEYKLFPITIKKDIARLTFQSFTATGKPLDNSYYSSEWSVIKGFLASNKSLGYDCETKIDQISLFDN